MARKKKESQEKAIQAYKSYDEYMKNIFDCVNRCLSVYLEDMKTTFSNGQGGYKNVLYPDLEIASDAANDHVLRFMRDNDSHQENENKPKENGTKDGMEEEEEDLLSLDSELADLLGSFGFDDGAEEEEAADAAAAGVPEDVQTFDVAQRILDIQSRAEATVEEGISMPFYDLCKKMEFDPFTIFCFACGILSSTQTDYAGIFQIVNENGGLSSPTIESAGRLYYGNRYSITGAYGDMSVCLEQLLPVLSLPEQAVSVRMRQTSRLPSGALPAHLPERKP